MYRFSGILRPLGDSMTLSHVRRASRGLSSVSGTYRSGTHRSGTYRPWDISSKGRRRLTKQCSTMSLLSKLLADFITHISFSVLKRQFRYNTSLRRWIQAVLIPCKIFLKFFFKTVYKSASTSSLPLSSLLKGSYIEVLKSSSRYKDKTYRRQCKMSSPKKNDLQRDFAAGA